MCFTNALWFLVAVPPVGWDSDSHHFVVSASDGQNSPGSTGVQPWM